jgi:hypothetical protein
MVAKVISNQCLVPYSDIYIAVKSYNLRFQEILNHLNLIFLQLLPLVCISSQFILKL